MTRLPTIAAAAVLFTTSIAAAQSISLSPNTVHGTIGYANSNPAVLDILQNQIPITYYSVFLTSTSPTGYSSSSQNNASTGALSTNYSLSSEASGGVGQVTYLAYATSYYDGYSSDYNFQPQSVTLEPTGAMPSGATLNFSETVTVHQIRFGTDATCDTLESVASSSISSPLGFEGNFGSGSVQYYLTPNYPPLGSNLPANPATLNIQTGNDMFTNTINVQVPIDVSAAGDTVVDHCIDLSSVAATGSLASIITPVSVAGHTIIDEPEYGIAFGPNNNDRWTQVAFDDSGAASASFINLLPGPWSAYVDLYLDSGDHESAIYTKQDWSGTPIGLIELAPGEVSDGSQTFGAAVEQPFVMIPADMTGSIRLYDDYAHNHIGAASTLSSLIFAEDYSVDGHSVYGAPSATSVFTFASTGSATSYTTFAGRYASATGELDSTYDIPVGLIYNQPDSWLANPYLYLQFSSTALSVYGGNLSQMAQFGVPSDSDVDSFRYGSLEFTKNDGEITLSPSQTVSNDEHACFNEVVVQMQSTTTQFVNPSVQINGGFSGTDFEGNTPGYDVSGSFTGQPFVGAENPTSTFLAARTNTGSISMTLPQGDWTLTPQATFVADDGTKSTGDFLPISLPALGCGQRVTLVPGLTISLDQSDACVPPTGSTDLVTLSGTINSGGAEIDSAWYTINGGDPVTICTGSGCGSSFSVPVALPYGDDDITVYASSGYTPGTPQVSETLTCGSGGCGADCVSLGLTCTPASYSPEENTYGMVAFEDLWPTNGDLDFNDQNVAYNYAFLFDGDGDVIGFQAAFDMLSIGAVIDNGLYLHLPIPLGEAGTATLTTGDGAELPLTPLASLGDSAALGEIVYPLATNTRSLFGNATGFINTQVGNPVLASTPLTLTVRFGSALAQGAGIDLQTAPFDLFIARTGTPNHQVHLPTYDGSATGASAALFGTDDDGSNQDDTRSGGADNTGRWYVNKNGLPFGLVIPQLAPWPIEGTNIENLLPEISAFAASAGATDQDFYSAQIDTSYSWQTLGGPGPIPPQPPPPGGSTFPGITVCQ